jgi:hypothetical protein
VKCPFAKCKECGNDRPARMMKEGVCPWCWLTVILTKPNPYL